MIFSRRFRTLSLWFPFIALTTKAGGAEEIPLGAIVMQLRSTVDTDSTELNQRVENVTTSYLNEYFEAYYTRTEKGNADYFEKIDLSTSSFGVHGVEGSFITTLEMEGILTFNSEKVPSSFFIDTLLRNAFEGQNEKLYLDQLLKEKEDQFLQHLTYVIIDVNKAKVAESLLQGNPPTVISTTDNNLEEPVGKKRDDPSEKRLMILIYVISVSCGLLILACCHCLHQRCRRRKSKTKKKHKKKETKEPIKVIKLPVKKQQSSSPHNYDVENRRTTPTSAGTTPTSAGSDSDHIHMIPPSPQRSLPSHCSSMFTSDMSKIAYGKTNNDIYSKAPSLSSPSKFSIDMPSIDLGAWRGGREDPPEFGSDISVIARKKDLSLIAEEKSDVESGMGKKNNKNDDRRHITSSNRRLSRKSPAAMHMRESKSRLSHRSETYFYNGPHVSNSNSDSDSDSESDGDGDGDGAYDTSTGDVICDLKNLSMQIEQKRGFTRPR